MVSIGRKQSTLVIFLVIVLTVLMAGATLAAEFGKGDLYRLPQNEIIDDDLYVSAGEIYIDGVVNGDLFAAGGYIEINGEVTGDIVVAGGGIVLNGLAGDDVRVAGGGIDIRGVVQDDLFVAGGGSAPGGFTFPITTGTRSIEQGVRVDSNAEIGGSAYIVGGAAELNGAFGGDLFVGMGSVILGGQVARNADINAQQFRTEAGARVNGQLTYSTPERVTAAEGVAPDVVYEEAVQESTAPNVLGNVFGWILRTLLMVLGFAGICWLLLRFVPNVLTAPADAIAAQPTETGLYGLVGAVLLMFIPVVSAVLVMLMWFFWGLFPALVMFIFLFGLLALLWFFSPLVTGLWLGRRLLGNNPSTSLLLMTLAGVLIVVILGRIPILGWLVYMLSFVFALGGMIRASRRQPDVKALSA